MSPSEAAELVAATTTADDQLRTQSSTIVATVSKPADVQTNPECPPIHDEEVVEAIEPFLTQDATTYQTSFNTTAAAAAGVSQEVITRGQAIVSDQNNMMSDLQAGNSVWEPDATTTQHNLQDPRNMAVSNPCGDWETPQPDSNTVADNYFPPPCAATRQDAVNGLTALGFHLVVHPYCRPVHCGAEYAKVAPPGSPDLPCNVPGAFRYDAWITRNSACCWTYEVQGPEPNPEVFTYIWPYKTWGWYVQYWHETH